MFFFMNNEVEESQHPDEKMAHFSYWILCFRNALLMI